MLANQRRGLLRQDRLGERLRQQLVAVTPDVAEGITSTVAIREALENLSDDDRELIQLTTWEGLAPRDVAVVFDVPARTSRRACATCSGGTMTLNRLVARANPYSDHTVSEVPTDGADLLQEIVTTTARETVTPARGRTFLHRGVMTVASAAAVAAVIAFGGSLLPQGDGTATVPPVDQPGSTSSSGTTASYKYASSVIAVAKANQRLLLDMPGWRVEYVSDFGVDSGEMTFARPGQQRPPTAPALVETYRPGGPTTGPVGSSERFDELSLMWYPAREYKSYYDDRANGNPAKPIEVLGQKGTMFQYQGSTDFTTILPPKGSNFLEIRANVGSERAYRELVGKLYKVDVQTWLDAMPASVVKPEQVKKAVDEMLADLPLPKGFDKRPLYDRTVTTDRYQVGARVTGAVTCAWIGKWIKAKDNGDAGSAKEAVDALKTSRSWKVLREMDENGAWSETVWEYSDMIARGESPTEYQQMLGCR